MSMGRGAWGGRRLQVSATQVAAAGFHTLVVLADGTMRAFGFGYYGQLGYGSTSNVGGTMSTLPSRMGPVPLGDTAIAAAAGAGHSLVLLGDGTVKAFGFGNNGRLGYGSTTSVGNKESSLPSNQGAVVLNGTAVAVAACGSHSLVLLDDGSVLAFGSGMAGQLGYGSTSDVGDTEHTRPSDVGPVPLGGVAVALAAGDKHSVALMSGGTVRTFGSGEFGQLGYGSTDNVGDTDDDWASTRPPVQLDGIVVDIAAGTGHTLVLLDDGRVRAFGKGDDGRLGYGSTDNVGDTDDDWVSSTDPVPLGGAAAAVAAGDAHSLVLLTDGSVLAFGKGQYGRLGYGSTAKVGDDMSRLPSAKGPVPLGAGAAIRHCIALTVCIGIAIGCRYFLAHSQFHGLALLFAHGQFHRHTFLFPHGQLHGHALLLAHGQFHGHALLLLDCHGDNFAHLLPHHHCNDLAIADRLAIGHIDGNHHFHGHPVAIPYPKLVGIAQPNRIAHNDAHQHSHPDPDAIPLPHRQPLRVPEPLGIANGTAPEVGRPSQPGADARLHESPAQATRSGLLLEARSGPDGRALLPSALGASMSMGRGAWGGRRLQVSATQVAAGDAHTLVVLADGTMRAFGFGLFGQLGYGSTDNFGSMTSSLPARMGPVPLGGTAVTVAAGDYHSLVLLEGGEVKAFGKGENGRLGYGSTANVGSSRSSLPSQQAGMSLGGKAVAVAAGGGHSVVLLDDGSVWAFGSGMAGQLGYGSTSDVGDTEHTRPSDVGPVPLGGVAVALAAGGKHSVALMSGGSVRAFGSGEFGQLGYGSTDNVGDTDDDWASTRPPVQLDGIVVDIAAGTSHTLVLLDDGRVRAFGKGDDGRLGYGSTDNMGDTDDDWVSSTDPVPLGGAAAAVAAGDAHSLVLLSDGSVLAFGSGEYGRLGYGSPLSRGGIERRHGSNLRVC
ncbi:hypothetical protein FNF31_05643 [Cafeteria roenbergensis]|uniref:RCC1-like domain-containing protein n=1 Tax=Cafeteria roenbergensis TaxID=33653 RepID=A0A5A8CYA9_CAFRO|nr:hypothetical protein FNF31_05643 [Cafeteria roenbergensis]